MVDPWGECTYEVRRYYKAVPQEVVGMHIDRRIVTSQGEDERVELRLQHDAGFDHMVYRFGTRYLYSCTRFQRHNDTTHANTQDRNSGLTRTFRSLWGDTNDVNDSCQEDVYYIREVYESSSLHV